MCCECIDKSPLGRMHDTIKSVKNDFAAETRNRKQFSLLKCARWKKRPSSSSSSSAVAINEKDFWRVCAIENALCTHAASPGRQRRIFTFSRRRAAPLAAGHKTFVFTSSASEWKCKLLYRIFRPYYYRLTNCSITAAGVRALSHQAAATKAADPNKLLL